MAKAKIPSEQAATETPQAQGNYTPELATGGAQAPDPRVQSPGWLWQWHREAWEVSDGHLVPRLSRLLLQAGVAGVEKKNGKLHIRQTIAARADRGWNVIPLDVAGPGTSYLKQHSASCILPYWLRVYPGSDVIECDKEAFYAWVKPLIGKVIPLPERYVLERLRARLDRDRKGHENKARMSPAAAEDATKIESAIAIVDAALNDIRPKASEGTAFTMGIE
jgi:hypothetical protein